MLDAEKIQLMTKLAHYENEQGKEDLKISRYYRSDYIGIGLLKNLLLISVGYVLLWGLIVAYNLDFLLDNLHKLNYSFIIVEVAVGYVAIVVVYSVITYAMRFSRYFKAKDSVQNYYAKLNELMQYYGETSRKSEPLDTMGGQNR